MKPGTGRARILIAIFTVAMFYASVCSTTCALGVCPNQVQGSASQDCDHTSPEHSNSTPHHGPEKPDCSNHNHPTSNFVKADGLPQLQLSGIGNVSVNQLFANAPHAAGLTLAVFSLSDLAPPPTLRNPLYQQISVLRI